MDVRRGRSCGVFLSPPMCNAQVRSTQPAPGNGSITERVLRRFRVAGKGCFVLGSGTSFSAEGNEAQSPASPDQQPAERFFPPLVSPSTVGSGMSMGVE